MKTPRFSFLVFALLLSAASASAGVFNIPRFVHPSKFALGLEPEISLSGKLGLGLQGRYTHGITELMNVYGILGTGNGLKRFRIGGGAVFDFFPDVEGQPGVGIATQLIYYRLESAGSTEISVIPYIHKSFTSESGSEFDPFLAVPIGMSFSEGQYKSLLTIAIGSNFKMSDSFRVILELGINGANTQTYISGGFVYHN